MKYFDDEQVGMIIRAISPGQSDEQLLTEKYGGNGSPPVALRNSPPTTNVVILENPNKEWDETGQFNCPVPGRGDCLTRIPRDDQSVITVVEMLGTQDGTVDLSNVRGMHLCSISGLLQVDYVDPAPSPGPSNNEQLQFFDELFFVATVSLKFRGQNVPGFTDIPLRDLVGEPGCCDAPKIHIDCYVPLYGGMQLELNLDAGFALPNWIDDILIATRFRFSGCGCPNPNNCGCGSRNNHGSVKGQNQFIFKPGLGLD